MDFDRYLFPGQLFPLGSVTVTDRAKEILAANEVPPLTLLKRHATGDWGDIRENDKKENDLNLPIGRRITSGYRLELGVRLWITTEPDRSATTIYAVADYVDAGGFQDHED